MKKMLVCLLLTVFCLGTALAEGALPAYAYPGDDPVEAAIANYTAEAFAQRYPAAEGSVIIPAPLIFQTAPQDDGSLLVYGNFWTFSYVAESDILKCVAGGECPGIITLVRNADNWAVATLEEAGDGTEYAKDIARLCHGDKALERQYYDAPYADTRLRFIEAYVTANGLDAKAYQDYGWDPVPLFSAAPHHTITALASEINPENLISVAVDARITPDSPDSSLLTVELIIPEQFDPEEVRSLAVGDAIYTQGQEVVVRTISEVDGYLVLNEGDYAFSDGSIWLYEHLDGSYWIADGEDTAWTTIATLSIPLPDTLLFLDAINPASGEMLLMPTVHDALEFQSMLKSESENGGPGFAADNVYVVFDKAGKLAMIARYYVPWQ